MMTRMLKMTLACLLIAPLPVAAEMIELNKRFVLPVAAIDATSFEVVENNGAGAAHMWCGASIYARKVLGQRDADLYLKVARGPSKKFSGRKGVVFTVEPLANAVAQNSFSLRQVGSTHSVSASHFVCRDNREVFIRLDSGAVLRR